MLPTEFKEQNFTFTKPPGMTDEQCGDLHVWKGIDEQGVPIIISCWKPSYEDLQEINKTGRIWLRIVGTVMPPVSVEGEYPFLK